MRKILIFLGVVFLFLVITFWMFMKPGVPVEELKPKYTNAVSKFIEVEGVQVHYRIEGSGPPIVLIPGTGAVLQTWDGWTEKLKTHRQVIRLDMPAFGSTGPPEDRDYSIDMYVRFLHAFMKKIGIQKFDLGGNSLGGQIAWNYALTYPEQVRSLILVDPGGFYDPQKSRAIVFKLANIKWLASLLSKLDSKLMVNKTLEDCYYDDSRITPEMKQMYYDMSMREGNRQAFADRVQLIATDSSADLSSIQCPTLVLWGSKDQLINVAMADSFKVIKNSRLIIYDKMGHVPQEEMPEKSVHDVMEFLQEVDTQTALETITNALLESSETERAVEAITNSLLQNAGQ